MHEVQSEMKGMVSDQDKRVLFKLLAVLLQYPDEELKGSVESFRDSTAGFPDGPGPGGLGAFLRYLDDTPLIALQEEYVRTFDMRAATCLNLTFHEFGDGKIRGAALADLSQLYRSAGYEPSPDDLPDFLPLVLEFLSVCPPETGSLILMRYAEQIRVLAVRLGELGSPYGHLLSGFSLLSREFMDSGE